MNAVDTLGQTALHRAALAGHLQTCRLLLSYGADPAIVSLQGFTAAQMGNEAVQQILNGTDWIWGLGLFIWFIWCYALTVMEIHVNLCLRLLENIPVRNSDVDYRLLEAAKAGDLDTVKVRGLNLVVHQSTKG